MRPAPTPPTPPIGAVTAPDLRGDRLLGDLLRHGDRDAPALTFRGSGLSYRGLRDLVARVAGGLGAFGLSRGERVAVYLDKRIETVAALFGISAAGGVLVAVNPVLRAGQVAHVLADCGAAVLMTTPERLRGLQAALPGLPSVRRIVLVGAAADADPVGGILTWADLCGGDDRPHRQQPAAHPDDPAALFYTSGSTGRPKGVVVTHTNLVVGAHSVAGYLGHTAADVTLSVLPLSFDAGFSQLTTTFATGGHVVLHNHLAVRDVLRLCAEHRITTLTCVPPLWWQLAEPVWPVAATRHLRYFASTGGRMPGAVLARLRRLFPQAAPYLMYGLTEAFRSTYLDPAQIDVRPDSIGRAIPGAEVLVLRPDGTGCDVDEPGELVHRGPLVTRGYWGDAERTAARFRTDAAGAVAVWSGDTVRRDAEGYLYFVGRADDMIKTSGYRVSPSEIEDVVYATGLVGEAVALGVPDEALGQVVVLMVAGPPGAACDVAALTRELRRVLPGYQVPRRVVVLDSLPRSGNGKFDRTALLLAARSEPAVAAIPVPAPG